MRREPESHRPVTSHRPNAIVPGLALALCLLLATSAATETFGNDTAADTVFSRAGGGRDAFTFTVNSVDDADDGTCDPAHCSLREAILASNASTSGVDTIAFDIPGAGPHVIQPTSPLPTITEPAVVDGYTQPGAAPNSNGPAAGSNAVLMVEIDGSSAGVAVSGLRISSGSSTIRGLAINRFVRSGADGGNGIEITGSGGNHIEGCFLGTDPGGTLDRGNQNGGVFIFLSDDNVVGGLDPASRNVMSGNDDDEVRIYGSRNAVQGNLIGTDLHGTSLVGPGGGSGVLISVGSDNVVGGVTAEAGNLITGEDYAIEIDGTATATVVHGNVLGPLLNGSAAPYSGRGVYVTQSAVGTRIGGIQPGEGNLISGNDVGVQQNGSTVTGTVVRGNLIGTAADGISPLGNGRGVWVHRGTGLVLGGEGPGEANVIAFNGADPPFPPQPAIHLTGGTDTDIRANSIHSNLGLAINLGYDEVTPNDSGDGDSGPNGLQNYPVVTAIGSGGASVDATLDSTASTEFRIDVYASSQCDLSGYGEAESWLGSDTVSTDGSGQAVFQVVLASPVPPTWFVTTTATDPGGSTSELSACFEYDPPFVDLGLASSDGDTTGDPGGVVIYDLTFANEGNAAATGVEVTETVPEHSTFAPGSSTAGWACLPDDGPGSVCTLAIGSVPAAGGGSAAFAVTVDDPVAAGVEQIADDAAIADDGASGVDPTPGNNLATDTTPVLATPDLGLVKEDGGALPDPGGSLAYTLSWTNGGDQGATGVELAETVPEHTTFDPAASSPGWVCAPDGDAGSSCTFAIGEVEGGGAGDSATFAVTLDGSLPPGTEEISNTAAISDDGTNGDDPTPDDNASTVVTDARAPAVLHVAAVPATADGELEECETVHGQETTGVEIGFSEALFDPPGDADPDDVTNPANYLVVTPGPDLAFDTIGCGAPAGDDGTIVIAAVAWDGPEATATLTLAEPLDDTQVRLVACGSTSLRDLAGRPLDGDGDGVGGDEFLLDFRSDPENLFADGHFDCSLGDWVVAETIPGAVGWDPEDADGSPHSGSAEVFQPSATGSPEAFSLGQCVALAPYRLYALSQSLRVSPDPGEILSLAPECELFDASDCLGTSLGIVGSSLPVGDTGGAWEVHRTAVTTVAGTVSGLCSTVLATDATGPAFDADLDRLRLVDETAIFAGGFETGDATRWIVEGP